MKTHARVLSLLLGLAAFVCTPAAFPQAGLEQPQTQAAPSYSDSELKSFAVAVAEVLRINDSYVQSLQGAKSPEEQQQIRQSASQEMVRAVEKEGMSVDRYKEIMNQARTDPAVAARVQEHLNSLGK